MNALYPTRWVQRRHYEAFVCRGVSKYVMTRNDGGQALD
jgi:hypothetical protein